MMPFPAPNRLHVWFVRRPLVASWAVVLASPPPADAERANSFHALGIHGDPVAAKRAMAEAMRRGHRIAIPYTDLQAFQYSSSEEDREWIRNEVERAEPDAPTVLDPTAGCRSIPFEAMWLGFPTIANDPNPLAWLILKATVEFPATFGPALLKRYHELARVWRERLQERLTSLYPADPGPNVEGAIDLRARSIRRGPQSPPAASLFPGGRTSPPTPGPLGWPGIDVVCAK